MPVLSSRLHLREGRHGLQTEGAFFVPEALTDRCRQEIQQEIEHHSYVVLPEQVGPVRTQAELFVLEDVAHLPAPIDRLHRELTHLVQEDLGDIEGVDLWHPNDVSIQRYAPNTQGISPHLDSKRYVHLIAIFTTEGSALFRLCKDRSGPVLKEWGTTPGSLVLMRAPGFAGLKDGRPFHTVEGPRTGSRYSVTFRMDSRRRAS
jgi:hypothetical protein